MLRTRTFLADLTTPVRAYSALRAKAGRPTFLLESATLGDRFGRYSIVGTGEVVRSRPDDPLVMLRGTTGAPGETTAARFATARIGAIPYDAVHALAKVPTTRALEGGFHFDGADVLVFDHHLQRIELAAHDAGGEKRLLDALSADAPLSLLDLPRPPGSPIAHELGTSDVDLEAQVRRAQAYIAAGDAFQIVLSRELRARPARRDPFAAYRALRALSPSPYMFLFEVGELALAGASPETLVKKSGRTVCVRPIAGTRPRGATDGEDLAKEQELRADPKERAEHVMLIDLARNDVGCIAETGSVALPRRMEVERHSHVMHLVSEVTGTVRPGVSAEDVFRAAFPAGTLSGAPKVRAMQIIEELEGRSRGFYGGAAGYATADGDLDFAIVIRSIVFRGDEAVVTAGAGVVEGSVPRAEAEETRQKARAALVALAFAEGAS